MAPVGPQILIPRTHLQLLPLHRTPRLCSELNPQFCKFTGLSQGAGAGIIIPSTDREAGTEKSEVSEGMGLHLRPPDPRQVWSCDHHYSTLGLQYPTLSSSLKVHSPRGSWRERITHSDWQSGAWQPASLHCTDVITEAHSRKGPCLWSFS